MESKKALAREVVVRFHGRAAAMRAEEAFVQQFKQKEIPDDIPEVHLHYDAPVWICGLLAVTGTVSSNGEGRRMIEQGAVKLDGEKISDASCEIQPTGEAILQVGKRRFARVIFN